MDPTLSPEEQVKLSADGFTDLTLTLEDTYDKITINVHKQILCAHCVYFEKLLTGFREKNSNDITIQVPNRHVAYDIIMEFYGQKTNLDNLPPWRHRLETIKCRDFWGLDLGSITDIIVPPEGFELLLNVIELMGYDNDTIRVLINSLPSAYDLSTFPKELINEMLRIVEEYTIISGNWDGTINVWDANTGKLIRTLNGCSSVFSVCYSSDNKRIISGHSDRSIKIWDASTGELIRTLNGSLKVGNDDPNFVFKQSYPGHSNGVNSVYYSSDDKKIISGSFDDSIKIWDADTGELIRTLNGHSDGVNSVCYSSDNKKILSGGQDNSIKIWDAATGELIRTLNGHSDNVRSVCYSPDNKRIISGGWDNSIKVWDATTGELIRTLNGHGSFIFSVYCSSDNKRIISGSDDGSIKVWDATTGELILTLEEHTNGVLSVCYSADNKKIISGSWDKSIKIWDATTGELIRTLNGHSNIWNVCSSYCNNELIERIKKAALQ